MVKIVTDSTADIPPELAGDILVVPCFIQFGTNSYLDGVDITREQFYERLQHTDVLPKTAAPSAGMFEEAYRRAADNGDQVLSLHVAGTLSAMVNSAQVGTQAFPPGQVTVYDSESVTMGLGWMCLAAARAAAEGKTVEQIIGILDGMKDRTHIFAALDTLEYLHRSGRVSWTNSAIGQLLRIKPIVHVYRGAVPLVDRVRTRARSIKRLVELTYELGRIESLAVLHTTAPAAAQELAADLNGVAAPPVPIVEVTPIIGTHVGPNALGVAVVAAR